MESRNGATVICLIPARVDTKYFQDIIFLYAKAVCFIKGRLKFEGKVPIKEYYNDWNDLDEFNQPKKKYKIVMKESNNSAPFPSAIVIFSPYNITNEQYKALSSLGKTYI